MKIDEIIKKILEKMPEMLLEVNEDLKELGITREIKISYYLYRQITQKLIDAEKEFHMADEYKKKQEFYKKDIEELENNEIICKHINQAYKKLLQCCVDKYEEKGIDLDIKSEIELLHPQNEITHSDLIILCNRRPIFCNPILDLLESKADYRIKYFARSLEENPHPKYAEKLNKKYGDFFYLTSEDREKLDKEIGYNFNGIYRDEFEEKLFEEFKNSSSFLEDNIKEEKILNSNKIYTESGLYQYLKNNKEKYDLEDNKNLQKSKIDFILDNLSYICSENIENNIMTKYLYYIRLIRRVFKENSIGDYNIFTCKYKNSDPKDLSLLLLLKLEDKKFSYILHSKNNKFFEISVEKLKQKLIDTNNPLVIYNKPYRKETGPLDKDKTKRIIEEFERD